MDENCQAVPMGLLDAHHHVRDLAVRDQPWTTQVPVLRRTFTADQLAGRLIQYLGPDSHQQVFRRSAASAYRLALL
jgi:transposase